MDKGLKKSWIKNFLYGICMGAADLVPGISGGTVAFILGFYHQLLDAFESFNYKNFSLLFNRQYRAFLDAFPWHFISSLFFGIALAFILLTNIFQYLFNHDIYFSYLYAIFFGLMAASALICLSSISSFNRQTLTLLTFGALLGFSLTDKGITSYQNALAYDVQLPDDYYLQGSERAKNFSFSEKILTGISHQTLAAMLAKKQIDSETLVRQQGELSWHPAKTYTLSHPFRSFDLWIVFCGSVAICAMLLPGISGTFLLQVLGVYGYILEALAEFIKSASQGMFESYAFGVLASMGVGIILGALTFAKAVKYMFKCYPQHTIALMTGFMLGALRTIWPFWNYEYIVNPLKLSSQLQISLLYPILPDFTLTRTWIALGLSLLSFLIILGLEQLKRAREKEKGRLQAL